MLREKLNPSNQDDWAKISSGDYLGEQKYESSSLAELDSAIEKIFQRYSFKNSCVKKRYALYYKGKLFRTTDNLFLFSSQEAALDRFLNCMGMSNEYYVEINLGSYVKKKYLESDLARYIFEDDKHSVKEFITLIDQVMASDEREISHPDCVYQLRGYIRYAIRNYIMQNVEIKEVEM